MVRKEWLLLIVFVSLWLPLVALAAPEVEVELDPAGGTMHDVFRYSIVVSDGRNVETPTLQNSSDFDSQYIGASSNIQIVNGQSTSEVVYIFELTPKRPGTLRTPTGNIVINGATQTITPLSVPVARENATPHQDTALQDVYLKREFSKRNVYEGEQFIATLKLYSRYRVEQGSFDALTYDNFWKEELGEPTAHTIRSGNGRVSVHEVKHALFPLRSGAIQVPPAVLKLIVRDKQRMPSASSRFNLFSPDFFGVSRTKNLRVTSEPDILQVLPLPPIPAEYKQPRSHKQVVVGDLKVSLGINNDPIPLGEGKTILVTLVSDGNIRPIDKLHLDVPSWIKVYADAPEEVVLNGNGKFELKKRFRISLVPERAGMVEIPGVSILSFSPETKKYRLVKSRPIVLQVKPSGEKAEVHAPPNPQVQDTPVSLQEVFRYREETLLEYFGRTISWSLSLFLFTLTLLLFGTIWFVYRLLRGRHSRVLEPQGLSIARVSDPLALREEFVRDLSRVFSGGKKGEVYRGYLLEKKLQELVRNEELQTALLRHLDQLDTLSYGGETEEDLSTAIRQSEDLLEQLKKALSST